MDKSVDLRKKRKYIFAWETMMGAYAYHVRRQLELAEAENAPSNAVYRNREGVWVTFDDIQSEDTKTVLRRILGES